MDTEQKPPAPGRIRAFAEVMVESSTNAAFDTIESGQLSIVAIVERFTGDLEGESVVRSLQHKSVDGSIVMTSIQSVRGRVGDRRGSYVLQGEEVVKDGKIHATWHVIPGSGSGQLQGLRGVGGFDGAFGKGSKAILDYWFE